MVLLFLQGVLMLQDQYRAIMQYSIPKELCQNSEKPPTHKASADWFCIKVIVQTVCFWFSFNFFVHFSVAVKILKEEITASSVTRLVWKVRKEVVVAMKFVIMLQKVRKSNTFSASI